MVSITYTSTARRPFTSRELFRLLQKCRANNERIGVTGLLLYKDGSFIQLLEGKGVDVDAAFLSANRDPRHTGIIKLIESNNVLRRFPDWPMAFFNLDTIDPGSVPGFPGLETLSFADPGFLSDPEVVKRLLEALREQL
jgi:hypothetical protein